MYNNDSICIKINGCASEEFKTSKGVRQGCILSPLLFNIFMSDLPRKLNQDCSVTIDMNKKINCLLWADDIILLSETEQGLRNLLTDLELYCRENGLSVNIDKTKCMIFNKTGRLIRRNFYLDGNKLENVRSYKYLGLYFTPSGEIKTALDDLRSRALKAYMKLKATLGNGFRSYVNDTVMLFDSLIKPILLYSSDFWGCLKLPLNNPIENLHMQFCKNVLGVQRCTTNNGVLLEIGREPIILNAQKAMVKNWERIRNREANNLLLSSYKNAEDLNLEWIKRINSCLTEKGMQNFTLENRPFTKNVHKFFFERGKDIFYQGAFTSMSSCTSKLRTYHLFKTSPGQEPYLKLIQNENYRTHLSKFRLSNHKLRIETGRHKKLPILARMCPTCPGEVEDEVHFLVKCNLYSELRSPLLKSCQEMK